MSFDKEYPNRKDHRKAYRRAASVSHKCRPHGGCSWCLGNRKHADKKREPLPEEIDFSNEGEI